MHGTRRRVRYELSDESAYEANGRHDHQRIGAAYVENTEGETLGDACLLNGKTQHDGAGEDHEDLTVDGLHSLLGGTATEREHGEGSEEGTLQQRHDAECREQYHEDHDDGGDQCATPDVGHIVGVEEMESVLLKNGVGFNVLRTYEQQRITSLQHHLSRCLFDALATTCDSGQCQMAVLLKRTAADGLAYQGAAKVDVGRAELSVHVQLAHRKDMVVGGYQIVTLCHLNQLVDMSGIHQMVTAHDGFVF